MNTDAHQKKDLHTNWVKSINDFFETGWMFAGEIFETCKIFFLRMIKTAVKETKYLFNHFTTLDIVCGGLGAAFGFVAALVCLSGFAVLGYQVILWLKDGMWTELPLFAAFEYLFENTSLYGWVTNPESWLGLQKITEWLLQTIPLSLTLIVPGALAAFTIAGALAAAIMIRYYQFKNLDKN